MLIEILQPTRTKKKRLRSKKEKKEHGDKMKLQFTHSHIHTNTPGYRIRTIIRIWDPRTKTDQTGPGPTNILDRAVRGTIIRILSSKSGIHGPKPTGLGPGPKN